MAVCDRLEQNLATAGATSAKLLDALLAQTLSPNECELEAAQ